MVILGSGATPQMSRSIHLLKGSDLTCHLPSGTAICRAQCQAHYAHVTTCSYSSRCGDRFREAKNPYLRSQDLNSNMVYLIPRERRSWSLLGTHVEFFKLIFTVKNSLWKNIIKRDYLKLQKKNRNGQRPTYGEPI